MAPDQAHQRACGAVDRDWVITPASSITSQEQWNGTYWLLLNSFFIHRRNISKVSLYGPDVTSYKL